MRVMISMGATVFAASLALTASQALAANEVQKECSTKYQAAKAANQLGGKTWNQYYKECAAAVKPEQAAAPATPAPAPTPTPTPEPTKAKAAKKPAAAPAANGAVFPAVVAPEFKNETAGKGRFKTCLAQYNANKAKNANGGMKWIEKGGGYYSECNKRIKG